MLGHYTAGQLISFAQRLDPGLTARDFADAGQRLDYWDDDVLAASGLTPDDVTVLREKFASWPRRAGASDAEPDGETREQYQARELGPEPDAGQESAVRNTGEALPHLAAQIRRGEESARRLAESRADQDRAAEQEREQAARRQRHPERERGGPEIGR